MIVSRKIYNAAFLLTILTWLPCVVNAGNIEAQLPGSNGSDAFQVQDSTGTVLLHVQSNGKVGIGTTDPMGRLDAGDRTDPISGSCLFPYTSYDFNGNNILDSGECWKGLIVRDDGTINMGHRAAVFTQDVAYIASVKNPILPTTVAQSFVSILEKDTLETGDRNQISLLFRANDDGGGSPDRRFLVQIEGIVEDPNNTTRKAGLRFLTDSSERMRITNAGNIGIGTTTPIYPLHMASGAHVTAGGAWTNASSREYKENIHDLTTKDAVSALEGLKPTRFNYKADTGEEYLGFISEDVPEIVANRDRKGLSPMDIVAVLTKVVQAQQKKIEELEAKINQKQ